MWYEGISSDSQSPELSSCDDSLNFCSGIVKQNGPIRSCSSFAGTCASWCAMSYVWLIVFLIVVLAIIVSTTIVWIYPMNPSFILGRYMCPKDAVILPVGKLQPLENHYQPYNCSQLVRLCSNLGNEICVNDITMGRPDAQIKVIRLRHAIFSGWQPICAIVRLPELHDTTIVCWNNFRALTLFRYMIQSGMKCPKELASKIPQNAKYRTGIWSLYCSVRQSVLDTFETLKSTKLVICGHSLGGVLGTAFAADLIANKIISNPHQNIWLYTYGSPRCANNVFCLWLRNSMAYCCHIQMERDVCYHLPQAESQSPEGPEGPERSQNLSGSTESYEYVGEVRTYPHKDCGWQKNHAISTYIEVIDSSIS